MKTLFLSVIFILSCHVGNNIFAQVTGKQVLEKSREALLKNNFYEYNATYKAKYPDDTDTTILPLSYCLIEKAPADSILGYYAKVENLEKFVKDDSVIRVERIYNGYDFYFINHNKKNILTTNPHTDKTGIGFTRNNIQSRLIPKYLVAESPYESYLDGSSEIRLSGSKRIAASDCWVVSINIKTEAPVTSREDIFFIDKKTYLPVKYILNAVWEKIQTEYQELTISYRKAERIPAIVFTDLYNYPNAYKAETLKSPAVDYSLLDSGSVAPAFQYVDINGTEYNLKNLHNAKLILIDFWYLGCAPCLVAMPELVRINNEFKGQGLLVLGMNSFDRTETKIGKVHQLVKQKSISYPLLISDKQTDKEYRVKVYPTYYLIKDNKIIYSGFGYKKEAFSILLNIIKENL